MSPAWFLQVFQMHVLNVSMPSDICCKCCISMFKSR
jgi:hypothetical protein